MKKKKIPGPQYKRRSGIYKISCTTTGEFYIGKSKNLHQRYCQHSYDLKWGIHPNPSIQRLYTSHGPDSILMELVELVDDKDNLETREVYWIETLKPTLNVVNTRLSKNDVIELRQLLGTMPNEEIAKKYNLTIKYLNEIIRGDKWNDTKERETD